MKRPGAGGDSKSFRTPAESERSDNHFTVLFWFPRCLAETVTKRGWFAVLTFLWHSNYFHFFLTGPFHSMKKSYNLIFYFLSDLVTITSEVAFVSTPLVSEMSLQGQWTIMGWTGMLSAKWCCYLWITKSQAAPSWISGCDRRICCRH